MTHHRPQRWLLLLVGVVALMAGCGAMASDEASTGVCSVDDDCVEGLKCYARRVCVAKEAAETPVVLRLKPPVDSGLLLEHFEAVLTGANQADPHTLVLTEPAIVRGAVKLAETGLLVPGTLIARAPGEVEGFELRFDATASETKGFELRVQPGHTYEVSFWPENDQIPPHYTTMTIGGSLDDWTLELPAQHQLLRVTGHIVAGEVPLPGLSVMLQDPKGRSCSTRDVTDTEGKFELAVDPSASWGVLRFEPKDPPPDPKDAGFDAEKLPLLLPSGRLKNPVSLMGVGKNEPIALGKLNVGPLPPTAVTTIVAQGPQGEPIVGAYVRLVRLLKAPQGTPYEFEKLWVEQEGYTESDGRLLTTISPGPGVVTLQPGPKSLFGRVVWTGELQAGVWDEQRCPERTLVTGTVQDYLSLTVPGSQVLVRHVASGANNGKVEGESDLGNVQPVEVDADAQGVFSLRLDPGSYAIWVQPPVNSGLARAMQGVHEVVVGQSAWWTLKLLPPLVLAGRVKSANGLAVAGVLVDVLAPTVPDEPGMNEGTSGASMDAHLLATAVSDANGQFEVLIAPQQVAP